LQVELLVTIAPQFPELVRAQPPLRSHDHLITAVIGCESESES